MKCIKETNGIIRRVSNVDAERMVRDSKASFTTKTEWRKGDPDYKNRKPKAKEKEKEEDKTSSR